MAGHQGLLEQHLHLRGRRDSGAGLGADRGAGAADAGPGGQADPRAGHPLLRCLPRPAGHRHALSHRLRHSDIGPSRTDRSAHRQVSSSICRHDRPCGDRDRNAHSGHLVVHPGADPHLWRLCGGGLSRRHRKHPLEPGFGGALAWPLLHADHALCRGAAGRAPHHGAAAQRFHRTAEGHGTGAGGRA